jgi:hypothetical protein
MNAATIQDQEYADEQVLYIAMELSSKQWKLWFGEALLHAFCGNQSGGVGDQTRPERPGWPERRR